MSYLAGPLTREQVSELMEDAPEYEAPAPPSPGPPEESPALPGAEDATIVPPEIAPRIPVYHLDPSAPWASTVGASQSTKRLQAGIVARVHLTFDDQYAKVDHDEVWEAVFFPPGRQFDAGTAIAVDYDDRDFRPTGPPDATYVLHLLRSRSVEVFKNADLKLYSRVGESREAFAERCKEAAEDEADAAIAKLKDRYEKKIKRVKDQLVAAERRVRELETDVQGRRQG